ncbi:3-beta hydroxysteroid dehydrogenase [Rhodococcus sp. RS1C4]|uniref:SDR family oxidoreductase n=1 Tax=Rhodococcus sp. 114MFTsu3.1 TaxID=1172184 RepID=UPI00037E7A0A|nr:MULTISPECIES: SDR family oxidoreductase [unclassified Rhodococcus (in: high G+C Gram-positive bacteria)]OZC45677.1 3-beta hydroxysteroid dehydrogenase [Rhodococcus sp. RS1C4]OZC89412.1 3-beta hydroxysteroid dehydrogenase [Rhodococcus sp. 06-418-1B]
MNTLKIAVAGGTGVVGKHVVDLARGRGHDVLVLTRSNGVDLVDGTGLDDALAGVDVVVDVASTRTMSAKESVRFFTSVTAHLLRAEHNAGVRHHVALSIVGVDEAPYSYYAGKVAQEQAIRDGDIPWTILRATQFHEFAEQLVERTTLGPLVVVPRMRCMPVAARDVARTLVELAEGTPAGKVPDLGGPREERMVDMVRTNVATLHGRHWVVEVPVPGAYGRAMRDGTLVPGADADHASTTFADRLG